MKRVNLEKTSQEDIDRAGENVFPKLAITGWELVRSCGSRVRPGSCGQAGFKSWEKQAVLEAQRIKKVLKLDKGGLPSVLTVLSFMSWQLASPLFEIEEESPQRVVFYYPRCAIHESRNRQNKPVFPCKTMKLGLLSSIAKVVESRAAVRCLHCPPDPHQQGYWCKWELSLRQ